MWLQEDVSSNFFDHDMPEGTDRFSLLKQAADEWVFLNNMLAVETPGINEHDLVEAARLRDSMINEWNKWVLRRSDTVNFMVFRSHRFDEAFERGGIFFAPGDKVLLGFSCGSVLVTVSVYPEVGLYAGTDKLIYEREVVELHCILTEPKNDELRVLPIGIVPSVKTLAQEN